MTIFNKEDINLMGMLLISPAFFFAGGGGLLHAACGILRLEPRPSAVKTWTPNHWTGFPGKSPVQKQGEHVIPNVLKQLLENRAPHN